MRNPDSIKARLKQIAAANHKPFDYLLAHYFTERIIYRLSLSTYAGNFILKGGLLLYTILENDARATRDIDFLAQRLNNTPEELVYVFQTVCSIEVDDAIRFDLNSVVSERIKEGADYEGVRVKVTGYLDRARHTLQIDVGFGDVVVPKPVVLEYPSLLGMERPHIQAYSHESIVAEKFEAMLALSEANSRMKDFYDVSMLARTFSYEGRVLYEAIRQTLERRATPLSVAPSVFSDRFSKAKDRQALWQVFQKRIKVADGMSFAEVMLLISDFLQPLYHAILTEDEWIKQWNHFEKRWE